MFKTIAFFFCISILIASGNSKESSLPKHIPGDTALVGRIDVKSLKTKPAIKKLKQLHLAKYSKIKKELAAGTGLELDKINTIWFIGQTFDSLFLIIQGDFNTNKVAGTLLINDELEIAELQGCRLAVYLPDKGKANQNLAAIIDDHTIAFGNPIVVKKYLKSINKDIPRIKKSQRRQLIKKFNTQKHLQIAFIAFPGVRDEGINDLLTHLTSGFLDCNLQKHLTTSFKVKAKSSKLATYLEDILHSIFMKILSQPGENDIEDDIKHDLARYLKSDVKNKTIILNSKISSKILNKAITQTAIGIPQFELQQK